MPNWTCITYPETPVSRKSPARTRYHASRAPVSLYPNGLVEMLFLVRAAGLTALPCSPVAYLKRLRAGNCRTNLGNKSAKCGLDVAEQFLLLYGRHETGNMNWLELSKLVFRVTCVWRILPQALYQLDKFKCASKNIFPKKIRDKSFVFDC